MYRIVYPELARPRLRVITLSPDTAPVLDCSEEGLRFCIPTAWPGLPEGTVVCGTVEFQSSACTHGSLSIPRSASVAVNGRVVHIEGRVVGVHLDPPGLPLSVLVHEQLSLLSRYPGWLESSGRVILRQHQATPAR